MMIKNLPKVNQIVANEGRDERPLKTKILRNFENVFRGDESFLEKENYKWKKISEWCKNLTL